MSEEIPFALNQEGSTIKPESIYIQHSMCMISIISFDKVFIREILGITRTTIDFPKYAFIR